MSERIAISKPEADDLVRRTLQRKSYRNLKKQRDLGLWTWTPDAWDSHVEDTDRLYFFWVYEFTVPTRAKVDGETMVFEEKAWFLVGNYPKSSSTVNHEADLELEFYEQHGMDHTSGEFMWSNMTKTKPKELRAEGMEDLEILAILGKDVKAKRKTSV